jgi:hypothetical protein
MLVLPTRRMCPTVQVSSVHLLRTPYAQNVSSGYALSSVRETSSGLTANLNLAGAPCTAFGQDIKNLTIQVSYESQTRCERSPLFLLSPN